MSPSSTSNMIQDVILGAHRHNLDLSVSKAGTFYFYFAGRLGYDLAWLCVVQMVSWLSSDFNGYVVVDGYELTINNNITISCQNLTWKCKSLFYAAVLTLWGLRTWNFTSPRDWALFGDFFLYIIKSVFYLSILLIIHHTSRAHVPLTTM